MDYENKFGEFLKKLRLGNGYTRVSHLAAQSGVPQSTLSRIESNKQKPSPETLKKLSPELGVSYELLMQQAGYLEDRNNHANSTTLVPILKQIFTDHELLSEKNIETYWELPTNLLADYIYLQRSTAMVGVGIMPGDLVICKKTDSANDGTIVVALSPTDSNTYFPSLGFFYQNGSKPLLRQANPLFTSNFTSTDRIIGEMVGLLRIGSPKYELYKDYLAVRHGDKWINLIDTVTHLGITPEQILSMIEMNLQLAKNTFTDTQVQLRPDTTKKQPDTITYSGCKETTMDAGGGFINEDGKFVRDLKQLMDSDE